MGVPINVAAPLFFSCQVPMFTFSKNKSGIVSQFSFNKPLEYLHLPCTWEIVHEELAEQYAKMPWKYCAVIVQTEPLEEKLWDDPKHAHRSYDVWCSEVEREARERAQDNYFTPEEIETIFKEHQFPKERYNWEEPDDDGEDENWDEKNIETEIKDAIFDAQVKMLYPAVIEEFKKECRYEYDEDSGEEVKVAPHIFAQKWKKRQLEIFLPRVDESVERVLPNAPEPFRHTSFAQYFFIEKEDKIEWVHGSGIGSQTRYAHGLMGHLFATLTKKYGKSIPTYFFTNTKKNDFKYIQEWSSFKVDRSELTGNYPVRWEHSESLFKGQLFEQEIRSMAHG